MADTSIVFDILARDKATTAMDRVKRGAVVLGAAIGALAIKFGKDSVSAFIEAEQAQDRLGFALGKFPGLADTNIDRLGKLNTELAKKTRFDDDATASGQAVLAQFVTTGHQLESLTPLMQDFAAKTGKDLPTAAASMGKAFLGNTRALKELGINYTMTGDKTTDMANITALMREKVGGFAEKEGKTAAGQAEILKNQFGELEEEAGSHLVPALMKLAGILLDVIGFIQENKRVVVPVVAVLGTLAVTVWAVSAAARAYTAVQAALNIVMSANPIGLVVIAIAALVAGLIFAYRHSETFRNIVHGAFHAVAEAGEFMWNVLKVAFRFVTDAFLAVAGAIVHGAEMAFGWIPVIGDKLHNAADAFDRFRDNVNASLNGVKDNVTVTARIAGGQAAINEIADLRWQLDHLPRSVTVGVISKVGNIPLRAAGGPVTAGMPYIVGEKNAELFVPKVDGMIMPRVPDQTTMGTPLGGGGITIQNLTLPNVRDAEGFVKDLYDYVRKNGPLRGLTA